MLDTITATSTTIPRPSGRNKDKFIAGGTIAESASFPLGERAPVEIPKLSSQDTSASLELTFGEEIESATTQELTDIPKKLSPLPFYDEEDILNLDAVIVRPAPYPSKTIRVKLTYEERGKPIPVEDPWE